MENKQQVLVLNFLNSMGSISTNVFGPYNWLDIDHVAAEIIRIKFGDFLTEEELVELIDQFRCDGELEDESGEWNLRKINIQKYPGYEF